MDTLGVDTGACTAWARAVNGRITSCGVIRIELEKHALARIFPMNPAVCYVERPCYRGGNLRCDPEDLLVLATRVGRVVERLLADGHAVHLIRPTDWKGGTPKALQNERTENALSLTELNDLDPCIQAISKGERHNAWDAIGIALYGLAKQGMQHDIT